MYNMCKKKKKTLSTDLTLTCHISLKILVIDEEKIKEI